MQGYYVLRQNQLPSHLQKNIQSKTADVRALMKQKVLLKNGMSVLFNTEWYKYNIHSENNSGILFADLEWRYQVPKKPLTLSLTFYNITNQSFFYSLNQSPISQSFFAVPLIRRNIFVSARFEL